MKKAVVAGLIILFAAFLAAAVALNSGHKWAGVDETVVERVAEKAGRPAREPYINTDQGDLLLFVFLLAGAAGGFAAGYYFRDLFGAKKEGGER